MSFVYLFIFYAEFKRNKKLKNSSGGGNSTAGAIGAGGAHYYLSGRKKIAVQTTGVIHKTIKIPKKVPKNGKLLFLFSFSVALIFFY